MSLSITRLPDEIQLHILSFLDKKDLAAVAVTCKTYRIHSGDFQIWLPKTEKDFGLFLTHGAKQQNKSWKKVYEELQRSREDRADKMSSILRAHILKIQKDELFFRGSLAISRAFGLTPPRMETHFYPTQHTYVNGRKITSFAPK